MKKTTLKFNFFGDILSQKRKVSGNDKTVDVFYNKNQANIDFSIKLAAYFTKNPNYTHTEVKKIIFQYFKSSLDYSITYKSNEKNIFIKRYSDFDKVRDKKSQMSMSASFIVILNEGLISWCLK